VIWPAERRVRSLFDTVGPVEPAVPGPGERDRLGRRLIWATGTCDVMFAVALVLMIFQPGG
jgi:hypothetical protein